jgi:hypothetical protein
LSQVEAGVDLATQVVVALAASLIIKALKLMQVRFQFL